MSVFLALRLTDPQVGPPPLWELIFERQTIGRVATNHIHVKRDRLARLHGTFFREAATGAYSFEPDAGSSGTYLNQERIGRRTAFHDGDTFALGAILFKVVRAPDFTAERLDEARRAQPDARSRAVFADWLESVGRETEAAWLRARETRASTLATLTARLSTNERAALAGAPIQQCARSTCPGDWSRLQLTPQPRLRTCAECSATLPFCTREAETTNVKPFVLE
ncbi:MAG: FHA domain-containing protein [Archangium sp.]